MLLLFCLSVSLFFAKEIPLEGKARMANANEQKSGVMELVKSFRHLPPGMPPVLIVTFLTWVRLVRHEFEKTKILVSV